MLSYGTTIYPFLSRNSPNNRGIQNYSEYAIYGKTDPINFLNIFCYGKFHIYLAKSLLGSDISNYA
jgi:hypothetical protein